LRRRNLYCRISVEENTAEEEIEAAPVLSTEEVQTETEENAGKTLALKR
jgi:hypothetical protein